MDMKVNQGQKSQEEAKQLTSKKLNVMLGYPRTVVLDSRVFLGKAKMKRRTPRYKSFSVHMAACAGVVFFNYSSL